MSNKTTKHFTGEGEIQFMAAARPFTNQKNGKQEYSIKIKLLADDSAVDHLRSIAEYKVDTKTNRALAGTGEVIINFTSTFPVQVISPTGEKLTAKSEEGEILTDNVPFFDSRVDSGKAMVEYKVIDYGDVKVVRLAGIALTELNLTEKEIKSSTNELLEKAKAIHNKS